MSEGWSSTDVGGAIEELAARLAAKPEPRREALALLCAALKLPRASLITDPERSLSLTEQRTLREWAQRRAEGEPLAYLAGEREFWSLNLEVSPAVLVPRPETELLVERALARGDEHSRLTVIDLGTGSGAIALAVAHERPRWRIIATDQSEAALAVARRNAQRLGLTEVQFAVGDWFEALRGTDLNDGADLVISNPPYVAADDPVLEGDSLRHEPRSALTPGADALVDLATLIDQAPRHLKTDGSLLLEHGADQAAAVRAKLVARGFTHVVSHRDLAGVERMTEGRWTDPSRS